MFPRPHSTLSILILAAVVTPGCEQLDAAFGVGHDRALVEVLTTHHGTAENGVIPDLGGDGQVRVFDTDTGWTVTLTDAFVVTRDVTLESCDGKEIAVKLYDGAVAEDIKVSDLDLTSVGGTQLGGVSLCGLTVTYGQFNGDPSTMPDQRSADMVEGATVYLRGAADKGTEHVAFEIRALDQAVAHLDLSSMSNGGPLRISGSEAFPVELTVSKTYDRFLDGVDFSNYDQQSLEADLGDILVSQTRVTLGQKIDPASFE